MTCWNFCSYLGPALAAVCLATEAASSPSDSTAPRRLALSQTTNTSLASQVLIASKSAAAAPLLDVLLGLATELSQSSITVVARNTTNANPSVTSSSLAYKPSSYFGSVDVSAILNPTAASFNATKGSSSTSATLSIMSSTTEVALLHDNFTTPTALNMISTTSSVMSHLNSTNLTSSPVSTFGAAGQQVHTVTTPGIPSSHSFSTSKASSSSMIPTLAMTSMSPTNSAVLSDGIALGAALLLFSKNAAKVGPDIVKPPTKTSSLKTLETIRSNLENAFKERGGIDTGGPCVVKTKRFRLMNRDLASLLLNDFRCAIDSVNTLRIDLDVTNPDPSVIADDLTVIGTWAQELETDEESEDDDGDDETTTTKDSTSQRISASSKLSSSASRSSASRTSTISSALSINATCYTGSEYQFPGSATASVAADSQSVVFKLRDFALSSFFAMDPPVRFTTNQNSSWATKTSTKTSSPTKGPDFTAPLSCMGDGSPQYRPTVSRVLAKGLPNADSPRKVLVYLRHKPHIPSPASEIRCQQRRHCKLRLHFFTKLDY